MATDKLYTIEVREQGTGRVEFSRANVPEHVLSALLQALSEVKGIAGVAMSVGQSVGSIVEDLRRLGDMMQKRR